MGTYAEEHGVAPGLWGLLWKEWVYEGAEERLGWATQADAGADP